MLEILYIDYDSLEVNMQSVVLQMVLLKME